MRYLIWLLIAFSIINVSWYLAAGIIQSYQKTNNRDTSNISPLVKVQNYSNRITNLLFLSSKKFLVDHCSGELFCYELATKQKKILYKWECDINPMLIHQRQLTSLGNDIVAIDNEPDAVQFLNTKTGTLTSGFSIIPYGLITLNPDGAFYLIKTPQQTCRYNKKTNNFIYELNKTIQKHDTAYTAMPSISTDNSYYTVGGNLGNSIKLFDVKNDQFITEIKLVNENCINFIALAHQARFIALYASKNFTCPIQHLYIWDYKTKEIRSCTNKKLTLIPEDLKLSACGNYLFILPKRTNNLYQVDTQNFQILYKFSDHLSRKHITTFALNPSGTKLITGWSDGFICLYKTKPELPHSIHTLYKTIHSKEEFQQKLKSNTFFYDIFFESEK